MGLTLPENPFLPLIVLGVVMAIGGMAYEPLRKWRLRRQMAKLTGEMERLQGELANVRAEIDAERLRSAALPPSPN